MRTDAEALALWNAWRRGRHWHAVKRVGQRQGWRAWRELKAHWRRMGLNVELPACVATMQFETQEMREEWAKKLGVPTAYVTYAALKSANEAAMRAALSATVIPDELGKQGDLFNGS